ncbi:flagellar brake protein [Defluviitalea phaphyphila]|uniref:flagellar brake protein n=1 Tax=Defluviitalea phaphyphila TaxID=1473580 RepID=UPI00072FF50F|nr:PilZ domain-containing protein [Defluviitalea phaphyphila]
MKSILIPGTKLEIKYNNEIDEKKNYTFISQIEEYIDENNLIISAPIFKGEIVPLRLNKEYTLIIYGNKGLYECKIILKKRLKKENIEMVKIEIISSLIKIQRRDFFRLECVIPVEFTVNNVLNKGIIKDISGGGIKFISNIELNINDEINFNFVLNNKKMSLLGIILTKEDSNVEKYKYQYRVAFKDISEKDQECIVEFIFLEQRRIVRQNKGL